MAAVLEASFFIAAEFQDGKNPHEALQAAQWPASRFFLPPGRPKAKNAPPPRGGSKPKARRGGFF